MHTIVPAYSLRLSKHGDSLGDTVEQWKQHRRYRADLRRLLRVGPYMVRDIGLTPEEANRELQKPFWKP
jgi:uncharacterized protein YjiS (DUF1127 family)